MLILNHLLFIIILFIYLLILESQLIVIIVQSKSIIINLITSNEYKWNKIIKLRRNETIKN